MKTYSAIYARTETKTIRITCTAETKEQASDIFDMMVDDSIQQEGEPSNWIDFDDMECIHAEDYVQDIEEVEEVST